MGIKAARDTEEYCCEHEGNNLGPRYAYTNRPCKGLILLDREHFSAQAGLQKLAVDVKTDREEDQREVVERGFALKGDGEASRQEDGRG